MARIPDSVYHHYVPNKEIANAIKKRLGELLHTGQPEVMLAQMVERRLKDFPAFSYSSIEDFVMQRIVMEHGDHYLDILWVIYNAGYFEHDTRKFLELYPWAKAETLIEDVEIVFLDLCINSRK